MLSLATAATLAGSLGSLAIVASLGLVSAQLRQSTKAALAASHQSATETLNTLNLLWAENEDLARIWLLGLNGRDALDEVERWRFDSALRAYLHICENIYMQATLGAGDPGLVEAEERGICTVFASEGVQQWWLENPYGFSEQFRSYVARLTSADNPGSRRRS